MRVILHVNVAHFEHADLLRPVRGWHDQSLCYKVRFYCKSCEWRGPDTQLSVGNVIRRNKKPFNAIGSCPHCNRVGTVKILQTMGVPLEKLKATPVLSLEVDGLQLDEEHVDFDFNWTMLAEVGNNKLEWLAPFRLHNGNYIGSAVETGQRAPAVSDVRGRICRDSTSGPMNCQCL